MMIEAGQMEITQGELKGVAVNTDSGTLKTSFFCPVCGVHIWNERDGGATIYAFRPGTLDNANKIRPGAHVWTRSKQAWVKLDPSIPAFEKMYDREKVWPAASLSRI
jgi:hypothetical protein